MNLATVLMASFVASHSCTLGNAVQEQLTGLMAGSRSFLKSFMWVVNVYRLNLVAFTINPFPVVTKTYSTSLV